MRFIVNRTNLSQEEAEALLRESRCKLAVDIETVSLVNTLPLGIAVAISGDTGFYFFNPSDPLLKEVIESAQTILIHNASFDMSILRGLGIAVQSYEDTMLKAYSSGILEKSLEALSGSLLHRECPSVTSQWKKKEQGNIGINHVVMGGMCIIHACNTYALWECIPETDLYNEIDRPCVELVIEMEKWGVLIDQYTLTQVEQETITKAEAMEAELHKELGDINLASNPQIVKALQAKGILGTRKTKAGAASVSEESLKPLDHPVTNMLLKYRSEMKTLTTYVPAFRAVDHKGRLHTSFGYTNTGRWNSSKPNLQNITRDEKFEEEQDA